MNPLDILDKTTIFHTMLSIGQMLPPSAEKVFLAARLAGDVEPHAAKDVKFSYEMHPDIGAISIGISTPSFKVAFVFDIWTDATFDFFAAVLKRNAFEVVLMCPSGLNGMHLTDCRKEWTEVLLHLVAMRGSLPEREPSKFLEAALTLDLCADLAVHPNDPARMTTSPARLSAVHFMLSDEHTNGWSQPAQ